MKIYLFLSLITIFINNDFPINNEKTIVNPINNSAVIYENIGETSLSFKAFDLAFKGWEKLKTKANLKENIIVVVDFSQPSSSKRFYLINMNSEKIIYNNYVAHGKNSGVLNAEIFSNKPSSYQSSLGFFRTGETYFGKHGLSLKLDGLEEGINHLARQRNIVIHSANYAEESFVKKYGRLGRSFGCPALPKGNYKELIHQIKNGTLLFIYHPKTEYLNNSSVLN